MVRWFGYKLHLVVDAVYELPISALLTTAKDNDAPHFGTPWERAKTTLPELGERAKSNALDKGYDEAAVHRRLWADGVVPLIAIRDQTEEENQVLLPESRQRCPDDRALRFDGFERARQALRYDLPKDCPRVGGRGRCELKGHCGQKLVRVKLTEATLRHLGPVPRDSKKFQRLYKGRTSVERVNERLKDRWGLDCVRPQRSCHHEVLGCVLPKC